MSSTWKSIEQIDFDEPIWVILYTMEWPDEMPGKVFPCIHGWYATEAEAMAVWRHFPNGGERYWVQKTYRRVLKR